MQALASADGPACLLAGGSDLLLELQQGNHPRVHTLVDVTGIEELCILETCRRESLYGALKATRTQRGISP
jgi:carbon-monoxide dehydrogenase medium subunit